jgi:hypothetical protein
LSLLPLCLLSTEIVILPELSSTEDFTALLSDCPSSQSYCIGWALGYSRRENSAEDVRNAQNSDDGEFEDDD